MVTLNDLELRDGRYFASFYTQRYCGSLTFEGNHIKPSEAKSISVCQNCRQKILVFWHYMTHDRERTLLS